MSTEDLLALDADIPDRRAFAVFVAQLAKDARNRPDVWRGVDLPTFLDIVAHYAAGDVDAFYRNWHGRPAPEPPTWRLVADILAAGRGMPDDWDVEP